MKQHVEIRMPRQAAAGCPIQQLRHPAWRWHFEPLKNLVAVKLRSDCMSVLIGVAVKPMSELG
jgi:hypothetical protein